MGQIGILNLTFVIFDKFVGNINYFIYVFIYDIWLFNILIKIIFIKNFYIVLLVIMGIIIIFITFITLSTITSTLFIIFFWLIIISFLLKTLFTFKQSILKFVPINLLWKKFSFKWFFFYWLLSTIYTTSWSIYSLFIWIRDIYLILFILILNWIFFIIYFISIFMI
jgi:hypothetical protein